MVFTKRSDYGKWKIVQAESLASFRTREVMQIELVQQKPGTCPEQVNSLWTVLQKAHSNLY